MPPERDRLEDIYRLEKENNRLLKGMRSRARWATLFRVVLLIAVLGGPIWLYFTYLAPVIERMNATMEEITGQKVQLEETFSGWSDAYNSFMDTFRATSSSAR